MKRDNIHSCSGLERSQERSLFFECLECSMLCMREYPKVLRYEQILTPNFDDVSMNLSWTFSRSRRDVCTINDFRIVITRFFVPGIEPFNMRKSFLTIP